jgi:hypothetical protein
MLYSWKILRCEIIVHEKTIYWNVSWLLTCTGQTSILKVGGGGTTYILPPNIGDNNVFFPLLSQKLVCNSCCIGIVPVKYIRLNWKLRKANNYMYSLSIQIGSALWPNMVVSIFETYWYREGKKLIICYSYSYFVQVNVLSYIKNL